MKAILVLVMLTLAGAAAAQKFPERRMHYVIPFAAGGESDIAARFQQELFRKRFPQEMTIEYKPGAGGALAWSQLNGMAGDGHTIMGVNLPHIVLQPLEGNVQYKTADLTPVYWFHYTPDAIVVAADSPHKTFQGLVQAAREKSGTLTFAGSGPNSANHAAHEKFNELTGVKTIYVPYKGTGDLTTAVLGQHVTGAMSYLTFAITQKGKVRALAVATTQRHPMLPDVPTFKELGLDWIDGAYRGIAVPRTAPAAVQRQVSDLMASINKDPDMRKRMMDGGFEPIDVGVDEAPAFLAARTKDYLAAARRMGLVK